MLLTVGQRGVITNDMDARSIIVAIGVAVPAFAVTLFARPAGAPVPPDSILPLFAVWPHDYLHSLVHINGVFDWPALVGIEYAFHFGVVPIGVVVAAYLAQSKLTHRGAQESVA